MAKSIRKGHRVRVLRDIRRVEHPPSTVVSPNGGCSPTPGHYVTHAAKGEEGVVEETFKPEGQNYYSAKVRVADGRLVTVRLTSLERLDF